MLGHLERPKAAPPPLRQVLADFGGTYAANGFIGFVFAASGPVAIILSVGTHGGLSPAQLASWVFAVFFINGLITLALSWRYQQPLSFFWTIPGTVLVGPALQHLSFGEVVGAYYATSLLIGVLGLSGWVRRATHAVPMPIVMGMVSGVFLRFGLDLVRSVFSEPLIAGSMTVAFLVLSAWPELCRRMPPLIGAMAVGAVAVVALGRMDGMAGIGFHLVQPVLQTPALSFAAMVELVVPLAITVLVVQNGQGVAVLHAAGHRPPINTATVMCAVGSVLSAAVGGICSCLTGPTNALITASGERQRQYTAAMFTGIVAMVFGLLSPGFTGLMLAAPRAFVMALGGLAMLRVLQTAFRTAFSQHFTLGALAAFLVTFADHTVLNIGAAFWGLLAGLLVSWLLDRQDFAALK
jgi:benzoate membrane transport protein